LKPHDVLQIIQSPETLGRTFTLTFISYLQTFLEKVGEIRKMPGENLNRLFEAKRNDLSEEGLSPREDLLTLLKDMQEYRRIMMEGKGVFHRRFLRIPFHHSPLLSQLYPKFHKILTRGIPDEVLKQFALQKVPALEHLQEFSKP
jgi:hypothetical protein